jgi:glutamate-1-semialdehyde 2,1-aminomutase
MPLAALGGRRDIMEKLAPLGPVYQAGTLSGNPVAVAAGLATLKLLPAIHDKAEASARALVEGLLKAARSAGAAFSAQAIGSMFGVYFRASPPTSFAEVMQCDKERFNRFFHAMLERGVYLAPSAYEAGFVSAAHTGEDLEATLAAARASFAR